MARQKPQFCTEILDGGHVAQTTLNWPENEQNKQSPTFWFRNHPLLLLLHLPQLGCPDPVLAIRRAFEVENEHLTSHSFPLIITQTRTGTFDAWRRRKRNRSGLRPSDTSQKLTLSRTLFGQIFVMFAFLYRARSLPCGLGDYLVLFPHQLFAFRGRLGLCELHASTKMPLWSKRSSLSQRKIIIWWWFVPFSHNSTVHHRYQCPSWSVCQRLLSESLIRQLHTFIWCFIKRLLDKIDNIIWDLCIVWVTKCLQKATGSQNVLSFLENKCKNKSQNICI